MQIGAILTIAGEQHAGGQFADPPRKYKRKDTGRFLGGSSRVLLDVLGQNLLTRAVGKLRDFVTAAPTVISEGMPSGQLLPARSAKTTAFITAWEDAVAKYVQQGAGLLLLQRVSSYSDLEYNDLLQFHLERQARLTQVYAPDGSLDMALVDATLLRDTGEAYRRTLSSLIPEQERFFYQGYVNRLNRPQEFRKLIEDGLNGQCGLRPLGTEVGPSIWQGQGAQVDSSAVIAGPAFIGAGTRIAACCTLSGASTIEWNCEVDCGTTVEQSCILQGAYLGVGLDVRRSIVTDNRLFHLDRNVELRISDRRLIGAAKPAPVMASGSALA